jgi:hypothetical protein
MGKLTVPPGCMGVELPNGKKLDATRSGTITIDDPKIEKFALKSNNAANGVLSRSSTGFGHIKENSASCTECSFRGFGWQRICPKCGADMKKEDT